MPTKDEKKKSGPKKAAAAPQPPVRRAGKPSNPFLASKPPKKMRPR